MAGDGLVFPKELDLIMDAVQSSSLCNMTRVSNANTCGVRVENVINMAKTNHHVDVPLEIVPYDSVLAHPIPILRWSLVSGEVTSLCSHSGVAKSNLLVLGSDVDIVLAKVVAQRSATIHALPYWFLLRGDVIVDHLDIDVRYPGIPASSDASSRRSFEVSTRDLDSPCNQSLLMLEKFYSVTYGKPFCIKTTWRDGIFSAIVQNAEL
ncbi:hypothetical protein SK128_024947 [Halocaridina rubra]|uniref:Uncharacterized protein n=1 Tax=Halocaridina rubra TaxID=373956 RepID=A0AAN8ZZ57_HALRR